MLIYVIAGEPSGDALGANLMAALRDASGGGVRFAGIGGAAMRAQGLNSLFPMADLSVMGLVEVLPRIPKILRRVRETVADIAARRPAAVITIDSWGFTGRVQRDCQRRFPDMPRIHYVAPMVWAWKPKRAGKLARVLDLLMTLLPFEPPYFEREGLRTVAVGHPVVEGGAGRGDGAAFRRAHDLSPTAPLLVALPGSRKSETGRLLPVYGEVMSILAQRHPDLTVVVPTVETVAEDVRAEASGWPVRTLVIEGRPQTYGAFAAATAALAASGTVALELAMAGLPSVIAYRVSPLSAFVAVRFLGLGKTLKWVTLVNILMDREVMPEYLQDRCRAGLLAEAVERLLDDETARSAMKTDMAEAMRRLGVGGPSPGRRAAETVLSYIAERNAR